MSNIVQVQVLSWAPFLKSRAVRIKTEMLSTTNPSKHWGFFIGGISAQPTSAVFQNESESRFAERFAESAANRQFHELIFDRRKYRVSGLWQHHQGKVYGRRSGLVFEL